jgi:hypothetical protein
MLITIAPSYPRVIAKLMANHGYLRYPTLHGDTIVFVSDDDLWRVPVSGGIARRLTAGLSEPSTPCLSHDGQWVAFVGRDEQHPEVYLMSAEGGPARRMTWLGPDVIVRGWTPEGHILFVTTYAQPFFRNYRAYTFNPPGGTPQLLPLGHRSLGWLTRRHGLGRSACSQARASASVARYELRPHDAPSWETARLLHIRSSALVAAGGLVWICKRRSDQFPQSRCYLRTPVSTTKPSGSFSSLKAARQCASMPLSRNTFNASSTWKVRLR